MGGGADGRGLRGADIRGQWGGGEVHRVLTGPCTKW